ARSSGSDRAIARPWAPFSVPSERNITTIFCITLVSILPLERSLQESDFVGRQIEEPIDDLVDLALGGGDPIRQFAHARSVFAEVSFPLAALPDRNLGAEGDLDRGAKGGEVQFVPVVKPASELAALGWREVEYAPADGG